MKKIVLIACFLSSYSYAKNGSFQNCMDKLGLRGNADKQSIYQVISISERQGIKEVPKASKVNEIRLMTPKGITTVALGTNGCATDSKGGNVYDFIADSIENTQVAQRSGAPTVNQSAYREELKNACRGIDPYLDRKLGPSSDRAAQPTTSESGAKTNR